MVIEDIEVALRGVHQHEAREDIVFIEVVGVAVRAVPQESWVVVRDAPVEGIEAKAQAARKEQARYNEGQRPRLLTREHGIGVASGEWGGGCSCASQVFASIQ